MQEAPVPTQAPNPANPAPTSPTSAAPAPAPAVTDYRAPSVGNLALWSLIAGEALTYLSELVWVLGYKFFFEGGYSPDWGLEMFLHGLRYSLLTFLFLAFLQTPLSGWLKSGQVGKILPSFLKQAMALGFLWQFSYLIEETYLGLKVLVPLAIGFVGVAFVYAKILDVQVGKYFKEQ